MQTFKEYTTLQEMKDSDYINMIADFREKEYDVDKQDTIDEYDNAEFTKKGNTLTVIFYGTPGQMLKGEYKLKGKKIVEEMGFWEKGAKEPDDSWELYEG